MTTEKAPTIGKNLLLVPCHFFSVNKNKQHFFKSQGQFSESEVKSVFTLWLQYNQCHNVSNFDTLYRSNQND